MTTKAPHYRGRFAPSPTGPLHFGTLVAAVGSYLRARNQNGEWLLRIEDVDRLREVAGAADDCLRTLERFGFQWHGEVVYQKNRTELYQHALDALHNKDLIYPCTCSRRQLRNAVDEENDISIYPGNCIDKTFPSAEEHSIRVRCADETITFTDLVAGPFSQPLKNDCGDFIVKRRDGLFAYQLAVVVDDAEQSITEIVRGADLLDSTPRQIYLQKCLAYPQPDYLHLPIVLDSNQQKMSKTDQAAALDLDQPVASLVKALDFLGQQPPEELAQASVDEYWQWAIKHWDVARINLESKVVL